MFGWQKRTEAREALRDEMSAAADQHARAVLADAMSQIDLRLAKDREDRSRADLSTQTAIESLRFAVMDNQSPDIGPLLAHVAEMCTLVAERIEEDRVERRALTEAIAQLARATAAPLDAPPVDVSPRVIGGTVLAASEVPDVIDLVAHDAETDLDHDADRIVDRDVDVDVHDPVPDPVVLPAVVLRGRARRRRRRYVRERRARRRRSPSRSRSPRQPAVLVAAEANESSPPESEPQPAPSTGSEIWSAFEKQREERSTLAEIDLRPRQGRLTSRRSGAGV